MNPASLVVLVVVLALAGLAIRHVLKQKKNGGCGCGCGGCNGTSCHCGK